MGPKPFSPGAHGDRAHSGRAALHMIKNITFAAILRQLEGSG